MVSVRILLAAVLLAVASNSAASCGNENNNPLGPLGGLNFNFNFNSCGCNGNNNNNNNNNSSNGNTGTPPCDDKGKVTYYQHPNFGGFNNTVILTRNGCHNVPDKFTDGAPDGISSIDPGNVCVMYYQSANCNGTKAVSYTGHCAKDMGPGECIQDHVKSMKIC